MLRRFSVNFAILSMALDAILVGLALFAATSLRPALAFLPFAQHYPELIPTPWLIYPLFAIEWVLVFQALSIYDGRRNFRWVDEFASLTLAALLASAAMAGTLYLSYRLVSRLLFFLFIILAYTASLTWRGLARLYFRVVNGSGSMRRVLIMGAGVVGRDLQERMRDSSVRGLQVVALLDDDPHKVEDEADVLGPLDQAAEWIKELEIDDVIMALPQRAYLRMNRLVAELHSLAVKVWVIPDYFRLVLHKAAVAEFLGMPLLDLRAPALNDFQRLVKRIFDLALTAPSLPLTLPLMGLIWLAVRLDSAGPAIFTQKRVGENGALFVMYKFRTMEVDADERRYEVEDLDENGQFVHKRADDPRLTRLGRWLRRTSLDELPQLFNVLKGEMSLVGPRPELPYLVELYEPWQRQRFAVPQGITGWWQISGRSDKPMHLNSQDDLYYVQHYSLLLDIFIIIKTLGVVVKGDGAF
ncbi:sugar transferase [Chloroflexota bacterium]